MSVTLHRCLGWTKRARPHARVPDAVNSSFRLRYESAYSASDSGVKRPTGTGSWPGRPGIRIPAERLARQSSAMTPQDFRVSERPKDREQGSGSVSSPDASDVLHVAVVPGVIQSDHPIPSHPMPCPAKGSEAMLQPSLVAARRILERCVFCCASRSQNA